MTQKRNSGDGGGQLMDELPVERLVEDVQDFLNALGEKALTQISDKTQDLTERLTDYADGDGGGGLVSALTGGGGAGGGSMVGGLAKAGLAQAKEKVKGALGGGGSGGGNEGPAKVVNIVETVDVGVPVSLAYNQWTQFEDFPSFMKKVENVEQTSDTELDWKAQVFLSHRKWQATIVEQIPDERIIWRSTADKGHVDGVVSFHEVTPDLTRIMLLLQYYPQGFVERTGNLWRAPGRRARLELKHFQRHVMTEAYLNADDVHGWRGEVHDEELVRSDEEVRAEEEEEEAAEAEPAEEEGEEGEGDGEAEDEVDEDAADDEDADEDDEDEDDEDTDEEEAGDDEATDDEDEEGEAADGEEAAE